MDEIVLCTLPALFLRYYVEQLEGMAPDGESSKGGDNLRGRGTTIQQIFTTIRCNPGARSTDWIRIAAFPDSSRHSLCSARMPADEPWSRRRSLSEADREDGAFWPVSFGAKLYPAGPGRHLCCATEPCGPREVAATRLPGRLERWAHEGVKEIARRSHLVVTEHIETSTKSTSRPARKLRS